MARARTVGVAVLLVLAVGGVLAARGSAQQPPTVTLPPFSTTSTTTPAVPGTDEASSSTTTTAPGSPGSDPQGPPTTADVSQDGDNGSPIGGGPGQTIPPDAQAVLDTIVRTASNDDHLLVAGERALLAAGVDPDQAARLAYGAFPVA